MTAALIFLRLLSWYVLRLGRDEIEQQAPPGMTARQVEWALAWQPMIATMVLVGLCLGIPLPVVWIRVLLGYGT